MVVGEEPVVMGDGEEAGGVETPREGVGKGIADPVERGVAGVVFEGKNKDHAARRGRGACVLGRERSGCDREQEQQRHGTEDALAEREEHRR